MGRLIRELWDTRRELTSIAAKENGIVEQLKLMGCRMPERSQELTRICDDTAFQLRLKFLQTELKKERRRRLEVEQLLKDVESECKEPFVVPALMQAFHIISQMTDSLE